MWNSKNIRDKNKPIFSHLILQSFIPQIYYVAFLCIYTALYIKQQIMQNCLSFSYFLNWSLVTCQFQFSHGCLKVKKKIFSYHYVYVSMFTILDKGFPKPAINVKIGVVTGIVVPIAFVALTCFFKRKCSKFTN